jgi:hypothetical protein
VPEGVLVLKRPSQRMVARRGSACSSARAGGGGRSLCVVLVPDWTGGGRHGAQRVDEGREAGAAIANVAPGGGDAIAEREQW